ncbi:hypothetical protein G4B84_003310 [Aspergillus flavus NRRL3357]|nr:uncharacterized protein G4B84_003310 [Aspergillus flavus NRRL3357]QMW28021.1 hypothetical protein G4B84_003310 [Aspergillus flavus NRRL3357]QMW40092.1 hypothetical protein G4B11_003372 [Aspergillus flavus]
MSTNPCPIREDFRANHGWIDGLNSQAAAETAAQTSSKGFTCALSSVISNFTSVSFILHVNCSVQPKPTIFLTNNYNYVLSTRRGSPAARRSVSIPTNANTGFGPPHDRKLTQILFSMSIASPINLLLLSLFAVLVYMQFRPKAPVTLPKGPAPIVFRTFTPTTLLEFNGVDGKPVYLAVRGRVFDVSPGRNFYGPGGPYENFAGRDASRGLACQSFDEEMLTKDLKAPLDDLKDLDAEALENLQSWEERFLEKYLVVGKLVAEGDPEAPKA